MKQFSDGHRCDFCGQQIMYLLLDSPAEAFAALFQECTFLELRSKQIRDPSQRVAEYWYCSNYCAREDLDISCPCAPGLARRRLDLNWLTRFVG
jgi:hypothetical protein